MFAHYIDVQQDEVVLHINKPSMKYPRQVKRLVQGSKQPGQRARSLQQRNNGSSLRTIDERGLRSNSQPWHYVETSYQAIRPAFRELVNGYSGQLYFGSTILYGQQLRSLGAEYVSDQNEDLRVLQDASPCPKHKKKSMNRTVHLSSGVEYDEVARDLVGINDIFQLDSQAKSTMLSISLNIKRNAIIDGALSSILNVNGAEDLRAELFRIKVRWPMYIRTLYANTQTADIAIILKNINDLLKLLSYASATILDREQLTYFTEAVIGIVDLRILLLALINLLSNANYTVLVLSYITRLFNADLRSRTLMEVYPLLREVTRSFVVPLFTKLAALLSTETVFEHTVRGRQHISLLAKYLYTMVGLGIISLEESQLLEKADSYNTRGWSILARNLGISQKPGSIVLQKGIQVLRNTYIGPIISGCVADIPSEKDVPRDRDETDSDSSIDGRRSSEQEGHNHPLTYKDLHIQLNTQSNSPRIKPPKKPLHYIKGYTLSVGVKQNTEENLYLIVWRQPQTKILSDKNLFMKLSSHVKLCRHKLLGDASYTAETNSTSEPAVERVSPEHAQDKALHIVSSPIIMPAVSSLELLTDKASNIELPSPDLSPLLSSSPAKPPPPPPPLLEQFNQREKKPQRLPTRLAQAAVAEQYDHSCSSNVSSADKQNPRDRYALSSPTSSTQQASSKADDLRLEHLKANEATPHPSSDSGGYHDPHVTRIRAYPNLRGLRNLVSDDDLMRICRADLADTNLELLTNIDVGSPRTVPHVLIRYNLLRGRDNPLRRVPFRELMNNHAAILAGYQDKIHDQLRSKSTPVPTKGSTMMGNDSIKMQYKTPSVNLETAQLNEIVAQHIVDISLSEVRQRFSKHSLRGTPIYTPRRDSNKRERQREYTFCINLSRSTTTSSWRPPVVEKSDQTAYADLVSSVNSKVSDLHGKLNATEEDIQSIQASSPKLSGLRKSMLTKSTTNLRKQVFQRSQQHVQSLAEVEAPPKDPVEYFPVHIERLPPKGLTQVSFDTWGNSDPVFYMLLACDVDSGTPQKTASKVSRGEGIGPVPTASTIELTELMIMRRDKSHPVPDPQFKAPKVIQRNCLKGKIISDALHPSRPGSEIAGQHIDRFNVQKNIHDESSAEDLELFESELLQYLKYIAHKSGDDINLKIQSSMQSNGKANHMVHKLMQQSNEAENQKPFNLKEHLVKARAQNYEMSKSERTVSELDLIVGGHSLTRRHLVRGSDGLMKPIPCSDDFLIYYANKSMTKVDNRTPFVDTSDQKEASEIEMNTVKDDTDYVYEDREYSLVEADDGCVRRHYRKLDQETGDLLCYISESEHGDEDVGQYYQDANGKAHVIIRVKYRRIKGRDPVDRIQRTASAKNRVPEDAHTTISSRNSIVQSVRGSADSSSEFNIARFLDTQTDGANRLLGRSIFGLSQALCDEIIKIALREYRKPKRVTELAEDIFTSLVNIASITDEQAVQDMHNNQDDRDTYGAYNIPCTSLALTPKTSLSCDPEDTLTYFGLSPVEARRISRGFTKELFSSSSKSHES